MSRYKIVLLLLLGISGFHLNLAIADDKIDREKAESAVPGAAKLLDCFVDKMKHYDPRFALTPSAELFVFDILTHPDNSPAIKKLKDDKQQTQFCKSALVKPYLPLYRQSKEKRKQRFKGKLGPLGGFWIETESPFIGSYYNMTGREAWGHSDITGDALSTLKASRDAFNLTPGGIHFLKHASQVPDLYHWKDEIYHAHTPSEDAPNYQRVSREERILDGQRLFKEHITHHLSIFLEELRINNIRGALLALGTIAHGTQDLVYHHGMTLGQHAGLAYAGGFQNPDYPTGDSKSIIEMEARSNTGMILLKAMELAGDCAWKNIVDWPGLGGDTVDELSKKFWVYMDNGELRQDIGYFSLVSYYGMATPYKKGNSKRKELENPNPGEGLIAWNSKDIMKEILNDLNSNKQVIEESTRLWNKCHN